jgi:hypothetical protein
VPEPIRKMPAEQRQNVLAYRFRKAMTENQQFKEVNPYRKSFFEQVIEQADKVGFRRCYLPCEMIIHQVRDTRFRG